MRAEPAVKRCIAYFDGQNLFHAARDAFGYTFPNYDPLKLVQALCSFQVWQLVETRFYTGVPDAMDKPDWSHFWEAKLAVMGSRGIVTYSRPLRYRNQKINYPDGSSATMTVGQEKGIDVRIALDVVRHSLDNRYDVALIFSQDQDFSEAVDDVRKISALNDRWIKVACAFPVSPAAPPQRGINGCDWIRIDRRVYDSCIDPNDYRKRPPS